MRTKYCSDEQLKRVINAPSAPCAGPCGAPLTDCNLINGADVHEDCRCLYRDCRKPLLNELDWQRRICPECWLAGGGDADSEESVFSPCQACGGNAHDVTTVKLRPIERVAK